MAKQYAQGYYKLVHPEKYMGDPTRVRFMSSWEYHTHQFFDFNQRVVKWSSEPIGIPYMKPTDARIHRYYPDYYCEYIDVDGVIQKEIVELKPMSQVLPPRANASQYEQVTYLVNKAKWAAAELYCKERGLVFRIITENSVYK